VRINSIIARIVSVVARKSVASAVTSLIIFAIRSPPSEEVREKNALPTDILPKNFENYHPALSRSIFYLCDQGAAAVSLFAMLLVLPLLFKRKK